MKKNHYLRHLEDQLEPPQNQAIIILLQGGRKDAAPSFGPSADPSLKYQAEQCSTLQAGLPTVIFSSRTLYGQLPVPLDAQILSQSFVASART